MKSAIGIIVTLATLGAMALANAQTVDVTSGQIQGAMLENSGAVFKGIPYAAPPVGDLRWREPAPVQHWSGIRDATAFGPACAQQPIFLPSTATIKEDCLYLNIWTGEWPSKSRKPVMVWIVGGGNFGDSATESVYVSDSLARRGVVLVTLNYRLGSFGFFSHPALTRESPHQASGNQGILDQIAALKWVRENIARFGGDPDNVTIFGESAGSLDVNVLMTSPLSKGLFNRAIGESGPIAFSESLFGEPNTLAQAEKRGEASASRWNLPPSASASELRSLSTTEILNAEPNYVKSDSDYKLTTVVESFPYLGVVVDGYVLPKNPAEVFAAGQQHRIALLLGSNSRERIPFTRPPMNLGAALNDIYGPLSGRAQTLYVGERDSLYGTPADQLATDASFRCGTIAQLAWHASAGNSAYEFEFAHAATGREVLGPHHASEIAFVFGTINQGLVAGPPNPLAMPNAVDGQVSDVMQQYWTNFAKTGDPNGSGLPVWPKFEPNVGAYIQFTDAGPIAKEGLRKPYCDLFIENVKRQMAR